MVWYVYVIYSERLNYFYKGSTQDVLRRVDDHNNGKNISTANKGPWKLVFARPYATKAEALQEEKRLKTTNSNYLRWYIQQSFNEVKNNTPE